MPFPAGKSGNAAPGVRRPSPVMLTSRSSPAKSDAPRASRSKPDDSSAASPEYQETKNAAFSPRPRRQVPHKKVLDEWAANISKWGKMPTRLPDDLVMNSRKMHDIKLSPTAYLFKLSRDPELDEQLLPLMAFIEGTKMPASTSMEEPEYDTRSQKPQAWVDHQVWLANRARSMTVPQQPDKILSPFELDDALRPLKPIQVSDGYPDSIYRRLVYIADADPLAVAILIKQATISQSWGLGELLRGHFVQNPEFSLRVEFIPIASVVTFLYHMPYLSLVKERKLDTRRIGGERLRATYDLSYLRDLGLNHTHANTSGGMFMTEGVMSVAVSVRDDRWWHVHCLNDEYPFGESRLEGDAGDEEDDDDEPEKAGRTSQRGKPCPSPREWRDQSRTGLQPIELDIGDPVLNLESSYSHWEPRVYALIILNSQLEHISQAEEMIYHTLSKAPQTYMNSRLINADSSAIPRRFASKEQVQAALDRALDSMEKLLHTVKQQEDESNNFVNHFLGVDTKVRTATSWVFRDPLFVGLNGKKDLQAMDYCIRISQSIEKLHRLKNSLERLIESTSKLREKLSREIKEEQQRTQRDDQAWASQLGLLQYVSHAVTIPLALYNIPHAVTKLPDNTTGLARVTMGLTAAFIAAPILLSLAVKMIVFLRRCLTAWWFRPWRSWRTKLRRE